ncbi:MAG TPA: molecular chaperone HtpG, partial [Syntrophorhabdaceae bacterium]|nr:molecular chaperone HtpG [Syntrophorhabdaceae bacterium]
ILHLKDEEKRYLDEWEIRGIVKRYSDFIEHPIVMEVEREKESELEKGKTFKIKEEETLNSRKAIWLKDKSEVTQDEYNEFYKHISHDFKDPLKVIHYKAEGTSEFIALLYLPSKAPFNILFKDFKVGPMLYVKRVQIMEHCEDLIPPYLRFIRGVIDSSDLPLNVSREILQNNRQVEIIKNNVTKKVLDTLNEMKDNEYEKYLQFHKEFAKILKEGLHYDFERREQIAELLLFYSTKTEDNKLRTLQDYVNSMKEDQKEIYYIYSPSTEEALISPYLEAFKEKDYEVLIFTDEIDEFVFSGFEYKGKQLKSVTRGDIEIDDTKKEKREKAKKEYRRLIELIKDRLKDNVKDVRFSGRLKDSPCCLVADEAGLDAQMEKILKAMGQEVPAQKRILELNPEHPLFASMNELFERDKEHPLLNEYIDLLYDQALILEGSRPKDPAKFARTVSKLMAESIK